VGEKVASLEAERLAGLVRAAQKHGILINREQI
jgi:hypothetical protein